MLKQPALHSHYKRQAVKLKNSPRNQQISVCIQISPLMPNCRLYIKIDLSLPGNRLQNDHKPLITIITIVLLAETI